MNKPLFICYSRCGTCKKAQKWLDEHGIEYMERPIKEDNPTADELKKWHSASGLPLKRFFNTSGQLYRQGGYKDRIPEMTDDEIYETLASDGMLVKRPLLVGDDYVLVGFKEKEWETALKP